MNCSDDLRLFQCRHCSKLYECKSDFTTHKATCSDEHRPMLFDDLDRLADLIRGMEIQLGKIKQELIHVTKEAKELLRLDSYRLV